MSFRGGGWFHGPAGGAEARRDPYRLTDSHPGYHRGYHRAGFPEDLPPRCELLVFGHAPCHAHYGLIDEGS